MSRRRCPECGSKLPYAARSCGCGWVANRSPSGARRPRRNRVLWALALLATLGLALHLAPRLDPARLANLYARFAFNYLPERFSSFAPGESPAGAYFYCAKRVVKEVRRGHSVETFPSVAESETEELPEGRYRVASYVDQVSENGEASRQRFVCTVRYKGSHWVLEDLAMGESTPARHAARE